ncbi:MAG: preprotein translocase subunit Tim44 [Caulobacteraceae bacterium]|nr:preprotein translocase subunit Tim44 [Caulobacteraceae bacterium]
MSNLGPTTVQFLVIIIFAILAAVVLYQLYAVLGRRVGRGPDDLPQPVEAGRRDGEPRNLPREETRGGALQGAAAIRARDPAFDVSSFLSGARRAYEMIVRAFAAGEREDLQPLLSPPVYKSFEAAISAREARGETETVEFIHPPRADLEEIVVDGDVAQAKVRFLAEHRSRTKGAEGEGVDDRRTAEVWTFERNLANRDPNWLLVRVDAAPEA